MELWSHMHCRMGSGPRHIRYWPDPLCPVPLSFLSLSRLGRWCAVSFLSVCWYSCVGHDVRCVHNSCVLSTHIQCSEPLNLCSVFFLSKRYKGNKALIFFSLVFIGFLYLNLGFFLTDTRVFSHLILVFSRVTNLLCREHPGHCHLCT